MECLDFKSILDIDLEDDKKLQDYVDSQIGQMTSQELISEEMLSFVSVNIIKSFLRSSVARRMAEADMRGKLFKEKPFVMDYEGVLLQGIIDAFWIEDGNVMLLDYKTDRVDSSQDLVDRYKKQLDLYADALSRLFGRGKKYIYSFCLKEVIEI